MANGADIDATTLDKHVSTHLADPDLMRADDFVAFFDARKRALLDQVASAMGKKIDGQGVTEAEPADTVDANDDTDDL